MPKRIFTADWHLFHENIAEYCNRKPASIKQMHQTLIFNHNQMVEPDDEVWVLGDVTLLAAEYVGRVRKTVNKFNGTKHLVLGNHDEWKARNYENAGFWTVHTAMWFQHKDFTFYMVHDPAKYTLLENNPKAIMLCGHIHQLFKHLLPEKRIINVGVDVWGLAPVTFDQILALLEEHEIL